MIGEQRDGMFWYRKDSLAWPGRKIGDPGSTDAQFAVDGAGVAHVVYLTSKGLVQVTRNGKLADEPVPGTPSAQSPRVAVDTGGNVELVYAGGVGQILHRVFQGDAWSDPQQLTVDGADSFAIDGSDNMHFLYQRRATGEIVYSSIANGLVNSVNVASVTVLPGGLAGGPAMAVDALGRPHVVFSTPGDGSRRLPEPGARALAVAGRYCRVIALDLAAPSRACETDSDQPGGRRSGARSASGARTKSRLAISA